MIEDLSPGISSPDRKPAYSTEFAFQYWSSIAWAQGRAPEEVRARFEALKPGWDAYFPGWDRPLLFGNVVPVVYSQSDFDRAVELTLRDLETGFQNLNGYYMLYPFNQVSMDPRVAEAITDLVAEREAAAGQIEAYINERGLRL